MRRLTALATLVLLFAVAACTGEDPDNGGSPTGGESSSPAPTEPLALTIEPPAGFTAVEGEDRDVLFAEAHNTYTFSVAGAEGGMDKIVVTSYLLTEGANTASYDSQAGLVTDYFKTLDQLTSLDNFYPTIVHRQDGVYRFGKKDIGGVEVEWQDHFVFAGQYMINISCMWDTHYAQIDAGCAEMTAGFPFPEEWTAITGTA